jgi:predicted RNase H-like HicB family nuclease
MHSKATAAKVRKFVVTLEKGEDGYWIVECPALPGCISQGKVRAEALENIKEAIELCVEVRREMGLPLGLETDEVEVKV